MNKRMIFFGAGGLLVVGAGLYIVWQNPDFFRSPRNQQEAAVLEQKTQDDVVLPVTEYASRRFENVFGEESQLTLAGYHTAEDIEFTDTAEEVPVFAIAEGVVRRVDWVSGYGGVMVVTHSIQSVPYTAIYGHIDVNSARVEAQEQVSKGQMLAYLGEGESRETDGERKHLHFGIYEGEAPRIEGYESTVEELAGWINPHDFFAGQDVDVTGPSRTYNPETDTGGHEFSLKFTIPENWEVEYDRDARTLNLFPLSGQGAATERARVVISYFDAAQFLTLSSVTIHEVFDIRAGTEQYTAKQYDIEQKPGTQAFEGQPSWRHQRHTAVDMRAEGGYTRYYSVAKHPELARAVFRRVLDSIVIVR